MRKRRRCLPADSARDQHRVHRRPRGRVFANRAAAKARDKDLAVATSVRD
jgi:hypothetical protein